MLAAVLAGPAFVSRSSLPEPATCRLESRGAFLNCNNPCVCNTPYTHAFSTEWYDQVSYPNGPNTDPIGNGQGALE